MDCESSVRLRSIPLPTLRSQLLALRCAAVQYVCYVIHVRNQSRLRAMNGGHSQSCFKRGQFGVAYTTRSDDPAQTIFGHLERGFAREDSAHRRQRRSRRTAGWLFRSACFPPAKKRGEPGCRHTLRRRSTRPGAEECAGSESGAPPETFPSLRPRRGKPGPHCQRPRPAWLACSASNFFACS